MSINKFEFVKKLLTWPYDVFPPQKRRIIRATIISIQYHMPASEMITIFLPKKVIAIHKTRNRNDGVTHVLMFHVGRQKQLLIESSDVGFPKTTPFITSGHCSRCLLGNSGTRNMDANNKQLHRINLELRSFIKKQEFTERDGWIIGDIHNRHWGFFCEKTEIYGT